MRENRAKHKLERSETVVCLSGNNSTDMIDQLGPLGFDAIWLEGEHGPVDFGDIPDLTRACDLWGMTSVVRVNQNNEGIIYRTFDLGAQGLVVPHVNTVEEAKAVVDAAKFHPAGRRGMYTSRQGYGVPDYVHRANDETLVIVLIEDIVAINNLAEILTVDHIDVFFVAPSDLAQTMGHLGDTDHPEVVATIEGAFAQIIAAGRNAGGLVSDANAAHYVNLGVRFLLTGWAAWVASGGQAFKAQVEKAASS